MKIARLGVVLLLAVGLPSCVDIGDPCSTPDCLPREAVGEVALRAEEAIPCCGEARTFDLESAYDNAILLAELSWRDVNVELQLASVPDSSLVLCALTDLPRPQPSRAIC